MYLFCPVAGYIHWLLAVTDVQEVREVDEICVQVRYVHFIVYAVLLSALAKYRK